SAILTRAIRYGLVLTAIMLVIGGLIGWFVDGVPGLVSAVVGAGLTALFMLFTAVSILIAARVTREEPSSILFFGIVLGGWFLKFIVFIVILLVLRGQPWLSPLVLFFAILAAVIGSLVVDVLAFVRAREPY